MENAFETSFIPQQPLLKVEGGKRRHEPVNFALILALVVFFVTIAVAGGMYFYKLQIDKRVLALSQELEHAEGDLDIGQIESFKRVATRIEAGKILLKNHNVFTIVLLLLEEAAAQNIGLIMLDFKEEEGKGATLSLTGRAVSYGAAYFQLESWRKQYPMVRKVEPGAITLDTTSGVVLFNADIEIDPEFTKYEKILQGKAELRKDGVTIIEEKPIGGSFEDVPLSPAASPPYSSARSLEEP